MQVVTDAWIMGRAAERGVLFLSLSVGVYCILSGAVNLFSLVSFRP